MKDLSKDIIKSIEARAVKPVPHWQYAAKKLLFLAVTIVAVLLSALAMALGMYIVRSIDWNVYGVLGYASMAWFMISAFPYAFVILLIIFLIFAYYFYRQTPKGHRINYSRLVILLIVFGLGLGLVFHVSGFNRETYFQLARMPYYHQMMFTKEKEWSQPEKGLLWGEVLNVGNDNFSLRDANGKKWSVSYDSNTAFDENISANQGQNVKMIGQKKDDNNFQAKQVQVWDGVMNCQGHRNVMMNGNGMMGNGGMMGGRGMVKWRW